jgi:NADP-dependent 3-hydroxy acid dehydrogenase YdfG
VKEQVRGRFADIKTLEASDIADAIAYSVTRPWHVCLNEILIRPTEQTG